MMTSEVIISAVQQQEKSSPLPSRKKYPAPQRPSIQELRQKYEHQNFSNEISKIVKPKSPKMRTKSMVKQMASMFNNKISQIIRRDTDIMAKDVVSMKKANENANQLPKPLPMPRLRHNKEKAPVPSPRTKSKSRLQRKPSCFVAEDLFSRLSVKDKALLYTQFVEDMSRKNPRFGRHAELIEASIQKEVARGEVVNEKQESVKQLRLQLEARCGGSGQQKREEKIKINSATANQRRPSRSSFPKSKEFEDLKATNKSSYQGPRRSRSLSRSNIEQLVFKAVKPEEPLSYATPKQIRANRSEILTPHSCLANQQLEQLFFSWLKEKHDQREEESQHSQISEMDEEKQKSAIDRLLEEAIVKLEDVEEKQQEMAPKMRPKKRQAPAVPQTGNSGPSSLTSSLCSSAKPSEAEESESGVSNLTKNTSDEEQKAVTPQPCLKEPERPIKPLRKKKMRRSLSWKKDHCLVETKAISSTDSETEMKPERPKKSSGAVRPQPLNLSSVESPPTDPSFVELDKSLLRVVNSPRKIKSAYTLTVFSPPPSNNQSLNDLDMGEGKMAEPRPINDLSFDQGFETGSNDMDSPIKPQRKPILLKRQTSFESSQRIPENPSGFSTPIKCQQTGNFNHSSLGQQQLFSPISVPLKNRRRSIYDSESRRSSIAMQVIREDHPLEHHEMKSPRNLCNTDAFFANAPTLDMSTAEITGITAGAKASRFWIKSSDFNLSFDLQKSEKERLKLLYEIFSQRSCETKEMHFGIDQQRFAVHHLPRAEASVEEEKELENISRLPQAEGVSQYWFSTGDLVIPFSGKKLAATKIQRIFELIRATVEENGQLRFGVDDVEFSNVPENWSQSPKFSMESNYSMLVGLQSGTSNGLEGRSKYSWPNTKPVPVSDLDQSEGEEEEQESYSPFSNQGKQFDLSCLDNEDLDMPRNSEAMLMSEDSFCLGYENEPLDQLFQHNAPQDKPIENSLDDTKLPEILNTLQDHQQMLSSVQERMSGYQNPLNLSCDSLERLKGTPEYLAKIKSIVCDISRIGSRNGFKDCPLEDLERYMFFLSRYADICLSSCSSQMDKILDALMEHSRAMEV